MVSVFTRLTMHILCRVTKPRPGPAPESICLCPGVLGSAMAYGLRPLVFGSGGVHVPACRSNTLFGLTGGRARVGVADRGQQKGREGAGGSDSVGRL